MGQTTKGKDLCKSKGKENGNLNQKMSKLQKLRLGWLCVRLGEQGRPTGWNRDEVGGSGVGGIPWLRWEFLEH